MLSSGKELGNCQLCKFREAIKVLVKYPFERPDGCVDPAFSRDLG